MRRLIILAAIAVAILALPGGLSDPEEGATEEGGVEGLVVLLTDYGTSGFRAGALEGSIYAANPEARISTITHEISAFNVAEGSYILAQAARYYPPGAVFVAEVNPGVGTDERSIVVEMEDGKLFVGPDNGLFTDVMEDLGVALVHEIRDLNLIGHGGEPVTFNGIEVYGPVGAKLAAGAEPAEFGPEVSDPVKLERQRAGVEGGGLVGAVAYVDPWGNLVTNIPGEFLEETDIGPRDRVEIAVGDEWVEASFGTTYADVPIGELVAFINSIGRLEIAVNMGSAAETMGVAAASTVRVRKI